MISRMEGNSKEPQGLYFEFPYWSLIIVINGFENQEVTYA